MEKKGELLNQLAMIVDLIEKANIETTNPTISLEVSKTEFQRIHKLIKNKIKISNDEAETSFFLKIGEVSISIFHTEDQ